MGLCRGRLGPPLKTKAFLPLCQSHLPRSWPHNEHPLQMGLWDTYDKYWSEGQALGSSFLMISSGGVIVSRSNI